MPLISFLSKTCKPIQNSLIHQLQKSNRWKSQISNYRYEIQINQKKKKIMPFQRVSKHKRLNPKMFYIL